MHIGSSHTAGITALPRNNLPFQRSYDIQRNASTYVQKEGSSSTRTPFLQIPTPNARFFPNLPALAQMTLPTRPGQDSNGGYEAPLVIAAATATRRVTRGCPQETRTVTEVSWAAPLLRSAVPVPHGGGNSGERNRAPGYLPATSPRIR